MRHVFHPAPEFLVVFEEGSPRIGHLDPNLLCITAQVGSESRDNILYHMFHVCSILQLPPGWIQQSNVTEWHPEKVYCS